MVKRTVAIVGASSDRSKFSNKAVRAYRQEGWEVYPINPKGGSIEGLDVCTSIRDVPVAIDRVSMYLPPAVGIKLLGEIQARGADEVWFNPGSESDELVAKAEAMGLEIIRACSIVDVGHSPGEYN